MFEVRRLDPEANNSSKPSQPTEENHDADTKGTPRKSQIIEVRGVDDEASNSLKPSVPAEEHHVQDIKVTNGEKEHTNIDSDLEDEDYSIKSKKVNSNVSAVRKSYPLYVYTYKVPSGLPFPFVSGLWF